MKSNFMFFIFFILLCLFQSNVYAQAWVDETTYITKTIYVDQNHPNADDSHPGTDPDFPLRTINAANSKGLRDTRIIIAPGVYRETVNLLAQQGKIVVIKDPAKTGEVVISGSDVFDEWVSEGNGLFSHYWPYDWGESHRPVNIDDGPFPGEDYTEVERRREHVYIDKDRYELVLTAAEMEPGKCRVDEVADRIYVMAKPGVDPRNSLVEIPIRLRESYDLASGVIFKISSAKGGVLLRGVKVEHANNTNMQAACFIIWSDNILVEDCQFVNNGGTGLEIANFAGSSAYGTNGDANVTVRNVIASHNGEKGMGMSYQKEGTDASLRGNVLFENVSCEYNNWRFKNNHRVKSWDAAGFKLVRRLKNITFNNCTFSNNWASGVWFDWHNFNITFNNCIVENNTDAGFNLEASNSLSHGYSMRLNNCISRYNVYGLMGYDLSGCEILNSQIYGNENAQLYIGGSNRDVYGTMPNWKNWVIRDSWIVATEPDQGLLNWFYHDDLLASPSWGIFSTMDADNNYWYHPTKELWFPSPEEEAIGSTLTWEEWKVESGEDANSTWGLPSDWPFEYPPSPKISYTAPTGGLPITIQFNGSGSIDPSPGGAITSYLWDFGDGTTSAQVNPQHTYNTLGKYQVSLTVTDNEGLQNTVVMLVFVDNITGPNGGIGIDKWTNVEGTTISDIPITEVADEEFVLNEFFYATAGEDSYADRISGYIFPPVTGEYQFYLSSDDQSELWLSTSASSADKKLIAGVPQWAPAGDYSRYASQISKPLQLVANQKYYIESLHKEGAWGDHVQVAWTTPNSNTPVIIPGEFLAYFNDNINPVVSITSPDNNSVVLEESDISIQATASDENGSIASVDFYEGGILLYSDTVAPYSFLWESVPVGDYTITVTAVDNEGATDSESIIVNVVTDPNNAPTALITSPLNASTFNPGGSVLVQATATENDPGDYISKVEFFVDGQLVSTDTQSPYEYTYSNITAGVHFLKAKAYDSFNKPGASESVMISDQPLTMGALKREVWFNIPGTSVSDIPLNTTPDETGTLNVFDAPTDIADQYGQRISGFIIPPQDGNYTFWINSDDHSELYLSTNADAANKQLIASVPGWAAYNDFSKYPEQQSASIPLQANQIYYVEALHKDNDWGDNLKVKWKLPDGSEESPVSSSRIAYFADDIVTPVPVSGVSVSPASLQLNIGDTYQLSATVSPLDAADKSVTWSSDNPAVATVSSSGLITAIAAGTSVVTVTTVDGGFTAGCTIDVAPDYQGVATYGNGGQPGSGDPWLVSNTGLLRIEAENYNQGGEGVAYHDNDNNNSGGNYRTSEGVDVQSTTDLGGGYNVGWISSGEWLEYSIAVPASGTYNINLRLARSATGSSAISVRFGPDSQTLLNKTGTISVPGTGGWQNWTTVTATNVSLDAGTQIMRVYMDGSGFNLNWIEIEGSTTQTVPVTGVALDFNMLALNPGQSQQLTETVMPSDASDKIVSWSSTDESVATVSTSGLVTAVAEGSAAITATTNDGGYTATCNIDVVPQVISVTGVDLSVYNLQLDAGQTYQLDATVYPSDATNKSVTWSSANTNIASVDNNGLVTAISEGMTDITVTTDDGSFTSVCALTVNATNSGNPGEGSLSVYPNPVQTGGQATVQYGWNDTKILDRVKVDIFDMNGYNRNTFVNYENDGDLVIDLVKHWGPALDVGMHTVRLIVYYTDGSLHIVNGYNLFIEN